MTKHTLDMRRFLTAALLLCAALCAVAQGGRRYEAAEGDPMGARIYTLENGMRVYLSANRDQPRVQTMVVVRAGGKNDPAETTGLAHYLEHIMFKGTTRFGTSDYERERPLLDSIADLYETYRVTTDPAARRAVYRAIDSASHEASRYSIANEYDKLMSAIGSSGSNAFTSQDMTCYVEDIPSNEMERWAMVQGERFSNMVVRGFHTELEAVYEEYNRGLTQDLEKVVDSVCALLFPNHPYGRQTVIGTQEHLKNPSIRNIERYFRRYYVPNNMAVCMSGDLDFDRTMDIVERHFGAMRRGADVPPLAFEPERPMEGVAARTVTGREEESVMLAWRMPARRERGNDLADVVSRLLSNGQAGLMDLHLNQAQRVLESACYAMPYADHGAMLLLGVPKEGQTLDEVKDLMLAEVARLARGEFDASLLEAVINNKKLEEMRMLEDNGERARKMAEAFANGVGWADEVGLVSRQERITRDDVADFVRRMMPTDAYAVVYKRQGDDPNEKKIEKPAISPIEMNRDKVSGYVSDVTAMPVEDIAPVFLDFDRDVQTRKLKNGNTMMYRHNGRNGTFSLTFVVARGSKADKALATAADYWGFLGTRRMAAGDIMREFYRLACSATVSVDADRTVVEVSGLAENEAAALALLEDWLANARADRGVYAAYVDDVLKARADAKANQSACYSRLHAYAVYGGDNAYTHVLSADELRGMDPQKLVRRLKSLGNYEQTIMYYGPSSEDDVAALVARLHPMAKKPEPDTEDNHYAAQETPASEVYVAPYDSKAVQLATYANHGRTFDATLLPTVALFNEYFGGGMNTVVFQELRESRGLAYQASALYQKPDRGNEAFSFNTFVISQNDKLGDCLGVFRQITDEMPASELSLSLARNALLKRLATERYVGKYVLTAVFLARRLGLDHDIDADIYRQVRGLTMADLQRFARENVSRKACRYILLGDEAQLDRRLIEGLGTVHRLSLEDIFGY